MSLSVFNSNCYREFLEVLLPVKGEKRGIRSCLAKYLNCRLSHLTQVISGKNHLSNEMAFKCTIFFKLNKEETHYFLLLLNRERAGNYKLADYYQEQINSIIKSRSIIKTRLKKEDELSELDKAIYYSSWHYKVIHILCSLPQIRTVEDIIGRLKLSREKVILCVEFLQKIRIITGNIEDLMTTGRKIHLDSESYMISQNHSNFRVKAMQDFNNINPDNLHFSGTYSFHNDDWARIKETFLKAINESEEIIAPSKQNTLGVVCLDLFKL